ncbi:MAG: hypothetical protein E5X09_21890, partial [Mesorhizobium sp.]
MFEARRGETSSGGALQDFVLMRVVLPRLLRSFGRHALIFLYWLRQDAANILPRAAGPGMTLEFDARFDPAYGQAVTVAPDVQRVTAR